MSPAAGCVHHRRRIRGHSEISLVVLGGAPPLAQRDDDPRRKAPAQAPDAFPLLGLARQARQTAEACKANRSEAARQPTRPAKSAGSRAP